MIDVVCPVCDKIWDLLLNWRKTEIIGGKVRAVKSVSLKCPSCQGKETESKIRLVEGGRG